MCLDMVHCLGLVALMRVMDSISVFLFCFVFSSPRVCTEPFSFTFLVFADPLSQTVCICEHAYFYT